VTLSRRQWQTKCCFVAPTVRVTIKSKIRYNGQEYSSPAELPPEVRGAYESALHDRAVKKRFVINGPQLKSEESISADLRNLCDDAMSVMENNGEVTIPNVDKPEPLLGKKEVVIVALSALGIMALVALRLIAR
jgi:hypothetical protein